MRFRSPAAASTHNTHPALPPIQSPSTSYPKGPHFRPGACFRVHSHHSPLTTHHSRLLLFCKFAPSSPLVRLVPRVHVLSTARVALFFFIIKRTGEGRECPLSGALENNNMKNMPVDIGFLGVERSPYRTPICSRNSSVKDHNLKPHHHPFSHSFGAPHTVLLTYILHSLPSLTSHWN